MNIQINHMELRDKLSKVGFTEEQCTQICEVLNRLPILTDLDSGIIDSGGNFKIRCCNSKMETPKKGEFQYAGYFDCEINGIDSRKIISVEVPKLSIEEVKPLRLKLEIMPFDFGPRRQEEG